MDDQQHLEALKDIRNIMERSTRFTSLSGWSLILPGIIAFLGWAAILARYYFLRGSIADAPYVLIDLAITLMLSGLSAYYISNRRLKRNDQGSFDSVTRRAYISFALPFALGSLFILFTQWRSLSSDGLFYVMNSSNGQFFQLSLLIYGLSLLNAANFTIPEIRRLGIAQCLCAIATALLGNFDGLFGVVSFTFLGWLAGFSFLNIIFGIKIISEHGK